MILHHGTSLDALDSIAEQGLLPHRATCGVGVWATPSWDLAVHYSAPALRPQIGAVVTFELTEDDDATEVREGRWLIVHGIAPDRLTFDREPVCSCHPGGHVDMVTAFQQAATAARVAGVALDALGPVL